MATISTDTVVRRTAGVVFSRLDDELLAIDTDQGFLYALNESAGRLWDLIGSPIAVSEVCAQLLREYAVDEPTCKEAVTGILLRLHEAGMIEVCDAAPTAGR